MKKWWKKVNRGLLLGAALLVGLIGFIVFKEIQFRQEVPKIQETAEAYVQEFLALNLSLEGEELGVALTDAQRAEKMAAMDRLIADYMATGDGTIGNYHVLTAADIRANYEETLKVVPLALYRDLDFEIPENRIDVTSEGNDYAVVSIYLQNISVEACGKFEQMFGGEPIKFYDYGLEVYDKELIEVEPEEGTVDEFLDTSWKACTYGGNVMLQMQRVNGEWRITGAYCYTWVQSAREIVDKEEAGK